MAKYCYKLLSILFLAIVISGCQSLIGREDNVHSVKDISVVHSSSSDQFSYIKTHKDLVRFCTETDIDIQDTSGTGFTFKTLGDSIGDKSSSGAVTLGGRDPTVLITRELMFRACELTLNTNAKPEAAVKIYVDTLKALLKIIKVHKGLGTHSVSSNAKNNFGVSQND